MAIVWTRTAALDGRDVQEEMWTYRAGTARRTYRLQVRSGKPLNALALQQRTLQEFAGQQAAVARAQRAVYARGRGEVVTACPVCGAPARQASRMLQLPATAYWQCPRCTHCFANPRAAAAVLAEYYTGETADQWSYAVDRTKLLRVQQVNRPKAQWVADVYRRCFGRRLRRVLDVGAGSGHFVCGCRGLGIAADGIELNREGQRYCRETFGFALRADDFTRAWRRYRGYQAITFWGVLEHLAEPQRMLRAAARALDGHGLLVAAVPRWDSLSTAVQGVSPRAIVRHLDPVGHLSVFTDSSLATLLVRGGFTPVAAWYYGLDAFEQALQYALATGDLRRIHRLRRFLPIVQHTCDRARRCDELVLADRPARPGDGR